VEDEEIERNSPDGLFGRWRDDELRNVTRLLEPGKLESEKHMALRDAPETLPVRVEAKKR